MLQTSKNFQRLQILPAVVSCLLFKQNENPIALFQKKKKSIFLFCSFTRDISDWDFMLILKDSSADSPLCFDSPVQPVE